MTSSVIDTLEFSVKTDTTLINETVKIVAQITVLVAGDVTEEALRADIRETMQKFIATDWQFSNMARGSDASGFERVTLSASSRVSEKENFNLQGRAREASRKGLQITNVQADTSMPDGKIEEAESTLRADIMRKVLAEQSMLNNLLPANAQRFRIHRVTFGGVRGTEQRNINREMILSAAVTAKTFGSTFSDENDALGNASKLTMSAVVVLGRAG